MCSIMLDNATNNDIAFTDLIENLNRRGKLHFRRHIFHVHCCAHILHVAVKDSLGVIEKSIENIWGSIKYACLKKFGGIVRQLNVYIQRLVFGCASSVEVHILHVGIYIEL